jgi:hypothetical protein
VHVFFWLLGWGRLQHVQSNTSPSLYDVLRACEQLFFLLFVILPLLSFFHVLVLLFLKGGFVFHFSLNHFFNASIQSLSKESHRPFFVGL